MKQLKQKKKLHYLTQQIFKIIPILIIKNIIK